MPPSPSHTHTHTPMQSQLCVCGCSAVPECRRSVSDGMLVDKRRHHAVCLCVSVCVCGGASGTSCVRSWCNRAPGGGRGHTSITACTQNKLRTAPRVIAPSSPNHHHHHQQHLHRHLLVPLSWLGWAGLSCCLLDMLATTATTFVSVGCRCSILCGHQGHCTRKNLLF